MLKKHFLINLFTLFVSTFIFAQNQDQVLFTIDNDPVYVSEFKYIYGKTNGMKADYSKASVDEYLDLYTKFKLQVKKAKEMKLDTIVALRKELDTYRKQLADSYLLDKEVTDRLIREAYERTQKDISFSHILFKLPANASPNDTTTAYKKAMDAVLKLNAGESFASVANMLSEDTNSKANGGKIGYITALLPNGFYSFESALYNTPVGKYSSIVRSPMGYHILKIDDVRPARGEVEVSHILIRKNKGNPNDLAPKMKIDSLYNLLKNGADFYTVAQNSSEDKATSSKGGYLGYFGINTYELGFEDAAFALKNDNDISTPIETSAGWHIIKRMNRKQNETYDKAKTRLKSKITSDARFELARKAMTDQIRASSGLKVNQKTLDNFNSTLDAEFLTYKWQPSVEKYNNNELISFNDGSTIPLADYTDFLKKATRKRLSALNGATDTLQLVRNTANNLFEDFIGESCMKYEEKQLDKKYPDFKALMREYEEGILLFEVKKINIWDKASQDTTGLEKFFAMSDHSKYQWGERVSANVFTIKDTQDTNFVNKAREVLAEKSTEKALKTLNKKGEMITVQEKLFEKGKVDALDATKWTVGSLTQNEVNKKDSTITFMKVEKVVPPTPKTLSESRGYVVADYQDYLEKKWIEELRKMYTLKINENVLKSIIK
ncbi:MAG: peptidylprolyl isomerase [Saprospiraceae bacterium]|nr:peptidylprolyl isomerase [Saprospiraceae bacterium]